MHFKHKKSKETLKLEEDLLQSTDYRHWTQQSVDCLNYFLGHQEQYHKVLNSNLKDPVTFRVLVPIDLDEIEVDIIWIAPLTQRMDPQTWSEYIILCGVLPYNGKLAHWIGELSGGKVLIHFQTEEWLDYKIPPVPTDIKGLQFLKQKQKNERRKAYEDYQRQAVKEMETGVPSGHKSDRDRE